MIQFIKKNNRKKGFSLVEMLVAVFIFSISVITVMAVLSRGLTGTENAKNKMIATFLAQEGVEYFRNVRDAYVISDPTNGWNDFLTKLTTDGCAGVCKFDDTGIFSAGVMKDLAVASCVGTECDLFYNETTGKYGYEGGNKSGFSRKMTVKVIDPSRMYVLSVVTWNQGGGSSTVSFSENLFNW